jgi:uncharacterized protein (DUF1778 family)
MKEASIKIRIERTRLEAYHAAAEARGQKLSDMVREYLDTLVRRDKKTGA